MSRQLLFLSKCRDQNITPKGLKVSVPKGIVNRDEERRFKRKCELEMIRKTIKRLYAKQQKSDEKLAQMKLELRNKFRVSGSWIENTLQWLWKKAVDKVKPNKNSLQKKFDNLKEEKRLLKVLLLEEIKNKRQDARGDINPMRKIIYNNSRKKLLELNLLFA